MYAWTNILPKVEICFSNLYIVFPQRFVFHQFTSTKLENNVQFPVEGLDMSDFLCPGVSSNGQGLLYDLQSCVCHFGGMVSNQWSISQSSLADKIAYPKYLLSGFLWLPAKLSYNILAGSLFYIA